MKIRYIILLNFVLTAALLGQTEVWESNGLPIRQGVHIEWQKTICPGGGGSTILFWSDTRNGNRDIFAQKVSFTGAAFWGEGGIAVTELPGRQEDPVAIEDGAGGAFIAWVDYRLDNEGDIFIQHINSEGEIQMDSSGVAICQMDGKQISISMCTDSSGGVFITWEDGRNGLDADIYGTHVDSDNNVGHPGTGVAIIEAAGTQGPKSIEYAGNGDALVVWSDARVSTENLDVYAQRINQNLELHFDSDGLPIANTTDLESRPKTTFMSGVKSCVVWQQGSGITEVVYQVVDTSGLMLSDEGSLTKDPASKAGPRVKRGYGGSVFASWEDYRYDSIYPDYFIQKIDVNGAIMWDSSGISIDSTFETQSGVRFTGDNDGGVVVVWERGTFPNQDIVSQHFDLYGNRQLPDSGLVISDADGNQTSPVVTSDEAVGQFIMFADEGSGSINLQSQILNEFDQIGFPENGITIMDGMDGDINYVRPAGFNDGSVLLTWEDNRYGKVLFGNFITDTGADSTESNGKQLVHTAFQSNPGEYEPVMIVSNESVYTGIFNNSSGTNLALVNRLDMNLDYVWDSTGSLVLDGSNDQFNLFLAPHSYGIACMWSEVNDNWDYDIYFTVLANDGSVLETETAIANESKNEYVETVFTLPDGDYMIFWYEENWNAGVHKYVRFDSSGTPAEGWTSSGMTLSSTGDAKNLIGKMLPDSNKILLVWENIVSSTAMDIYSQAIDLDGNALFGNDPLILTDAINDKKNPSIAIDDGTTALITWSDFRNGDSYSIYGQRVDLTNAALMDSNILICCDLDTFYRDNSEVIGLVDDEFFVVWEDERGSVVDDPLLSGGLDIYGAKITGGSADVPIVLVAEYHNQNLPQLISIGETSSNTWLLHWQDLRSSGKTDLVNLYGQVLHIDPILDVNSNSIPIEFSVGSAYPNPFNGSVTIPIRTYSTDPIRISIYNILGRHLYEATLIPNRPGEMKFHWMGTDILGRSIASGIYVYQVQSNDNIHTGKVSYLK